MPPFPKPRLVLRLRPCSRDPCLRSHKALREIPELQNDRLLLATWNVANLGVQDRRGDDYRLLAEVCGWFDLIALQEVNDDLEGLRGIQAELPDPYGVVFSEAAGNNERQAFLYDSRKVALTEKVGRLSIPPSQLRHIKLPGSKQPFAGFDRGPYLAAFRAGSFTVLLVNVHLFYGSEAAADIERRSLETFAVAWWADRRRRSKHAFTRDIVPLGDFNLPRVEPGDPIYRALTAKGLALPEHATAVGGSSLGGRNHYDQIAFFPARPRSSRTGSAPSTSTTPSSATSGRAGRRASSWLTSATTSPTTGRSGPSSRSSAPLLTAGQLARRHRVRLLASYREAG